MKAVNNLFKFGIISVLMFTALIVGGTLVVQDALRNDKTVKNVEIVQEAPKPLDQNSDTKVKTDACEFSYRESQEPGSAYIMRETANNCIERPSPPAPVFNIYSTQINQVIDPLRISR